MERSENEEDNPVLGAIVVEDLEAPSHFLFQVAP